MIEEQENTTPARLPWLRVVGTLAAFTLIFYLLRRQGWDEIGAAVGQIGWRGFLLAQALLFVSRFMIIVRWHILLRSAGVQISLAESARLSFAGLFASNFLPSTVGGDVVRLAGAVQAEHDGAIATASLVIDRLIAMTGMALILPVGLVKVAAAGVWGAELSAIALPGWLSGLLDKGKALARRLLDAMRLWLHQPQAVLQALLFSLLHMVCMFASYQVILTAIGEDMSLWMIGGLWSLVYFVTVIPISINGLGVQEVAVTFFFATVGGISQSNSLILALMARTVFMLASLPGALFMRDIMPELRKKK